MAWTTSIDISHFRRAGSPRSCHWQPWCLLRPSSCFRDGGCPSVPSHGRRGEGALWGLFFFLFFFEIYLFLIEGQLLYNIMLVSVKHHHESALATHMSHSSWISLSLPSPSHRSRLFQSSSVSSLIHQAHPHWLSNLHVVIKFPCHSLHTSPRFLPTPHVHKSVLCVCVSIAALQIISSVPSF